MKKLMLITLCISLFAAACSTISNRKAANNIKWLATKGKFIVNKDNGEKRILRGVNVSGLEYDSTGRKVPISELMTLANRWNINVVRLPINQQWWLNNENGNYRKLIDNIIDSLKSRNIYTIFDLQWINTKLKINPLPNQQSVELMKQVAKRYKNEPAVIYDIYNEPRDCTHQDWAAWAVKLIEGIRGVHPNALILVNGIDWGYDLGGFMKNPLPYKNIVYGSHLYPQKPGSGYKSKPEFDKYWKGILDKNLPLFIGEIGPEEPNYNNEEQLASFLDPHLALIDSLSLGYTAWSWHNKPFLTKNGDGNVDSLTAFGKRVFNNLKQNKRN
ncbi:hypothetical protein ABIB40_002371 [Pedobacter sp. UYP30]|uniref:glycoside hydrolase family 5 protein n=1 Tax=Pedobacter sp. UYP30 TaxID=1756400 RepID=UPI003391CA66